MTFSHRWAHILLIVLSFGLPFSLRATHHEKQMNVILLLVDDWGWTDGSVFGSDLYETPNIDRLAAEGIRFTQGYAACTVCSPSRAAVLTGLYPARLHLTDWIAGHSERFKNRPVLQPEWTQRLEHDHITIAEVLQEHGYRTANVGKWHLTPKDEPGGALEAAYWPEKHGFEVNIAGNQWGAPGSYFAPFDRRRRYMANMPEAEEGAYLTDVLTDETIRLIEQWSNEPFFIYMPYYTVHTPIQSKPEIIEYYRNKVHPGLRHTNPAYAAMVHSLDESVGRILETLERLDLSDKTLIILTGDNGGLDPDDKGRITNNAPLRDGKGSEFEGGVRVPFVIRMPGDANDKVNATPAISNDIMPTVLSALELETHAHLTDGIDLMPVIRGESDTLPGRDLFWHYPHYHTQGATPYSAIRSGDYRLIEYHIDGNVKLYNLKEDIGETLDLSRKLPHIVNRLRDKLHAWRQSVNAQMPIPNPEYHPLEPTTR